MRNQPQAWPNRAQHAPAIRIDEIDHISNHSDFAFDFLDLLCNSIVSGLSQQLCVFTVGEKMNKNQ